tara:strand:+ start:329 stop:886 length:558 start_codon:yes stop_codon:yes gene_type:complete
MDDNNFTYLEDIIDLDEPGNENEGVPNNTPYSHYSEPPKHLNTSHDLNSIRGSLSTQEMFQSRPQHTQPQPPPQYMPRNEHNKHGQYTPISKVEQFNHGMFNHPQHGMFNEVQEQLPSYSESKQTVREDMNEKKIEELTNKYEELCYICKKLNDNDRIRYHYVYNIIIIFLIVVILLLVKKVLQI